MASAGKRRPVTPTSNPPLSMGMALIRDVPPRIVSMSTFNSDRLAEEQSKYLGRRLE